jgi:uncharacterized delta-60 repeat protein
MPTTTRFHLLAVWCLAGLLSWPAESLRAQQLDPAFHPPQLLPPAGYATAGVHEVVRQADGRYVIAGRFAAVDGHATTDLARLLPDGQVDTTFTYRPPAPAPRGWTALAVQADGTVLAAPFDTARQGRLLRVLPSGWLDATFRPALQVRPRGHYFDQLLVQPDGKLLLAGNTTDARGRYGLLRLLPDGQVDPTFNPPALPDSEEWMSLLLEPDERLVFAHSPFELYTPGQVVRLLASGRVDSSFRYQPDATTQISKLARHPAGGYVIGGWVGGKAVGRLGPTGARDTTFVSSLDCLSLSIGFSMTNPLAALAVQPDGRVLAAGSMLANRRDAPLLRSLPQGGPDPSMNPDFFFVPYQSPYTGAISNSAQVSALLMEPTGHLLVGGVFTTAGGVGHSGLARLLPAAPLASRAADAGTGLAVWPVPARGQLYLQLPAGRPAGQLTLRDLTGRTVLTQQPEAAALVMNVAALPAGSYVLQVRYADGASSTRRVVLE